MGAGEANLPLGPIVPEGDTEEEAREAYWVFIREWVTNKAFRLATMQESRSATPHGPWPETRSRRRFRRSPNPTARSPLARGVLAPHRRLPDRTVRRSVCRGFWNMVNSPEHRAKHVAKPTAPGRLGVVLLEKK